MKATLNMNRELIIEADNEPDRIALIAWRKMFSMGFASVSFSAFGDKINIDPIIKYTENNL